MLQSRCLKETRARPPKPGYLCLADRWLPDVEGDVDKPVTSAAGDSTSVDASERLLTPVVGMVASAGGLAAFKDFFQAMPADSGLAFVVVPHLDPDHESLMVPLLTRQTHMPVTEATDGQRLEPDNIYVIPPGRYLKLREGVIRLHRPPTVARGEIAIDPFLRSLAEDQHENAIGIILSGTGSHGMLGLRAIKAYGGMAMAQAPETAEYDRMPSSAIDTGLVDYILPPGRMPEALLGYLRHFKAGYGAVIEPAAVQDNMVQVLTLLCARTRFDFRVYRQGMLLRRIQRRMGLNQLERLSDYLELLREQPEELDRLCNDLLISVTAFFRDPEMFEILETQVLPRLLEGRPADNPVRVWVPGCATGEEAYSLAMLLIEQIEASGKDCSLQVFATDVDEHSLAVARQGVYTQAVLAGLDPHRRERFFTRTDADDSWQVNKQLRESVLFATQNLLSDACFSKLDLVSCRNLFIYLEPSAQQQLLQLFHFALNEDGYLILGPSENIGRHAELYQPVSRKWRIFRRLSSARPVRAGFPIQARLRRNEPRYARGPDRVGSLNERVRKILLQDYAPAAVVIDLHYQVLNYSGNTRLYLRQPEGSPSSDLLALAPPRLRPRIHTAVHRAMQTSQRVDIGGIHSHRDGHDVLLRIVVQPLEENDTQERLFLVIFQEEPETQQQTTAAAWSSETDKSLVHQLEYELKTSREELHSSVEELESSNEELNASNEEIMSSNEELQSTNEELESSKEELQSLNEELITVNAQLRDKVVELEETNNDMVNLMACVDTAILFIGMDGVIRRITHGMSHLFNLIDSDVGRPLGDINRRFEDPSLQQDIESVLQDLVPRKREVQSDTGQWFQRTVTPYRTTANQIDGVVLSFTDITQIKCSEMELRQLTDTLEQRVAARTRDLQEQIEKRNTAQIALQESEQRLRTVINDAPVGMCQTNPDDDRLLMVNPAFCAMTGYSEAELLQRSLSEITHPQDRETGHEQFARHAHGELPSFETQQRYMCRDGSVVWGDVRVMLVRDHQGQPLHSVVVIADITEQRRAEDEARKHLEEASRLQRLQTAGELATMLAHELNQPLGAISMYAEAGERLITDATRDRDKLADLLAKISQQSQRAGEIIRRLRTFVSTGVIDPEPLDLRETVQNVCELMEPMARNFGIELHLDLDENLRPVMAAKVHIEQVLLNLIRNALQAIHTSDMNNGRVTISTRCALDMARVSVCDNGPGVDADAIKGLFTQLARDKASGLGVGLHISRSLIEAHSGRLWVEAHTPGALFHFELPFAS